jgi:hypothetical protein
MKRRARDEEVAKAKSRFEKSGGAAARQSAPLQIRQTNGREQAMFSKGFEYRAAVAIKDFGERLGRVPVIGRLFGPGIRDFALAIRELALRQSAGAPLKQ